MTRSGNTRRYFFIDGDNNPHTALNGIELLTAEDTVLFFYSPGFNLTRLRQRMKNSLANIQTIESVKTGKNALDFQIIIELGILIGQNKVDCAYIISQDQGYSASVEVLKSRYSSAFQEVELKETIEDCFPFHFILKAHDKQQLYVALVKEYGHTQGSFLYHHLNQIFHTSSNANAETHSGNTASKALQRQPEDSRCTIWP